MQMLVALSGGNTEISTFVKLVPMTSEYKPYIQMVINIYRWIIGIVGSIVFTEIMQLLYVKYMNLRFVKFVNRIGKETLQIYVMQCFFLEGVISTVVTIVANKLETNILAYNIVCYNTVITLGINKYGVDREKLLIPLTCIDFYFDEDDR